MLHIKRFTPQTYLSLIWEACVYLWLQFFMLLLIVRKFLFQFLIGIHSLKFNNFYCIRKTLHSSRRLLSVAIFLWTCAIKIIMVLLYTSSIKNNEVSHFYKKYLNFAVPHIHTSENYCYLNMFLKTYTANGI